MKKITGLFLFVFAAIALTGCGKEDDPKKEDKVSTIQVTVKDESGNVQSNIKVYVFSKAATEPGGTDPAGALKTAMTNEDGVAEINVSTIKVDVVYLTVFEELLTKELNVLGSVEFPLDGETTTKELVITKPALKYKHGFIPSTISSTLAMNEYNRWKSTQVVACNGGLRVKSENAAETKVEGMGFGMLLSAYAKDKTTFDGLFTFYKSKTTPQANHMMAWDVICDGFKEDAGRNGSASDGDIDVAFSLIVASKQWPDETYLDDAKAIINIVRESVIKTCPVNGQSVYIVGPGYNSGNGGLDPAWGGCDQMDIMYHTPAFFRVFAEVTGDEMWDQLAEDTYVTLNAGAHPTTGLVPDWQTATGTPGPNGRVGNFAYDACRAPWKLTLDYLWNGNAKAETWAKKVATWANGVGPANIVDGYKLDGTPIGTNGLNSAFLGGFSVATMSHGQATVDKFSTELGKLNDTYWFNINTRVLYLFTLTGNFWDPMTR